MADQQFQEQIFSWPNTIKSQVAPCYEPSSGFESEHQQMFQIQAGAEMAAIACISLVASLGKTMMTEMQHVQQQNGRSSLVECVKAQQLPRDNRQQALCVLSAI